MDGPGVATTPRTEASAMETDWRAVGREARPITAGEQQGERVAMLSPRNFMKYLHKTFVFILMTVFCAFDPKVDSDERFWAGLWLSLMVLTVAGGIAFGFYSAGYRIALPAEAKTESHEYIFYSSPSIKSE